MSRQDFTAQEVTTFSRGLSRLLVILYLLGYQKTNQRQDFFLYLWSSVPVNSLPLHTTQAKPLHSSIYSSTVEGKVALVKSCVVPVAPSPTISVITPRRRKGPIQSDPEEFVLDTCGQDFNTSDVNARVFCGTASVGQVRYEFYNPV